MTPKKRKAQIYEKIQRMYENYGIDTSTMDESEFERLIQDYSKDLITLDKDLEKSEAHKDKYSDDVI